MALRSVVYKAQLQLSDLDRGHFGEYNLTLAKHPSETEERMMVRLLAFALHASETLQFGKGLSNEEEAALWEINPTGEIDLWIEVGLPDETRVKKACSRSNQTVVLTYGRTADLWWKNGEPVYKKLKNLKVIKLSTEHGEQLAKLADRNMKLSWTIQEGLIYLGESEISVQQVWPNSD